jgi:SAM-dependent methyltransferase
MLRKVWPVMVMGVFASLSLCSLLAAQETQTEEKKTQEKKTQQESKPARKPDVFFLPTPHDVVAKMLETAKLTKNDVLYDLGCGDGRIVVAAAKKYGCKCIGYDIDPKRVAEARANAAEAKVGHLVKIEEKDIFELDLSKASVVTLYLLPALNVRLIPQLEKLKPGSRIVSHDFPMGDMHPEQEIKMTSDHDNWEHTVYFWITPLKKTKSK